MDQYKSKLQVLYRHQKYTARIINFKNKFTSAKPPLEQINAIRVYEMNIFRTLCFMYLCKNGNTASISKHIYTTRSKNVLLKPLCKKNLPKFNLSYRGQPLWKKFIVPNNDLFEDVTIKLYTIQKDYLSIY